VSVDDFGRCPHIVLGITVIEKIIRPRPEEKQQEHHRDRASPAHGESDQTVGRYQDNPREDHGQVPRVERFDVPHRQKRHREQWDDDPEQQQPLSFPERDDTGQQRRAGHSAGGDQVPPHAAEQLEPLGHVQFT